MLNGLRFGQLQGKERIVLCSQMSEQRGLIYVLNLPDPIGDQPSRWDPTSIVCDPVKDLGFPCEVKTGVPLQKLKFNLDKSCNPSIRSLST